MSFSAGQREQGGNAKQSKGRRVKNRAVPHANEGAGEKQKRTEENPNVTVRQSESYPTRRNTCETSVIRMIFLLFLFFL